MKIGYVRVSKHEQHEALQIDVNPNMKLVVFTTILLVDKLFGRACSPGELW